MFSRRNILKSGAAAAITAGFPVLQVAKADDGVIHMNAIKLTKSLDRKRSGLSQLWTYNGQTPGPEIRVGKNERVRVRFNNFLDEPTSIHWHGIRIDNAMDGVSGLTQDPVPKGGSFDYDFAVPDVGTFWYHAHNNSWIQVARGLYGSLIVEDEIPVFDREHDLTLILDDWRLDEKGQLDVKSFGALRDWSHAGRLGNWLTVNSLSQPEFALRRGEAYRLRLINSANARIMAINAREIGASILALDGQALEKVTPVEETQYMIAPAQRVDLLVKPKDGFSLKALGRAGGLEMARFKVSGETVKQQNEPVLIPNQLQEPELKNAARFSLVMNGGAMGDLSNISHEGKVLDRDGLVESRQVWAFNGIANNKDAPFFSIKAGKTVILDLTNDTRWPHGIHIHGHHFRSLKDENETEFGPWRDTILIDPQRKMTIAFVADNPGKWLLHCHMLEHAAGGMNTWFEVV